MHRRKDYLAFADDRVHVEDLAGNKALQHKMALPVPQFIKRAPQLFGLVNLADPQRGGRGSGLQQPGSRHAWNRAPRPGRLPRHLRNLLRQLVELDVVQMPIEGILRQQLLVNAAGLNMTLVNQKQPVARTDGGDAVWQKDCGSPRQGCLSDRIADVRPRQRERVMVPGTHAFGILPFVQILAGLGRSVS